MKAKSSKPRSKKCQSMQLTKRQVALEKGRRFLWHFQPAEDFTYSHVHWWKEEAKIPVGIALWEVFRRSPSIPSLRKKWTEFFSPPTDAMFRDCFIVHPYPFMATYAHLDWTQLANITQRQWEISLCSMYPRQGGFHPFPVTVLNREINLREVFGKLWTGGEARKILDPPPAYFEFVTGHTVSSKAQWCSEEGLVVLAVDPLADGVPDIIAKLLVELKRGQGGSPKKQQHRVTSWLQAIVNFEEGRQVGDDSKLGGHFIDYRKLIGRFKWQEELQDNPSTISSIHL